MKHICTIIAGINGAGKTTFALEYLRKYPKLGCFINVDLIAAGLSPHNTQSHELQASRLFLQQMKTCIQQRQNFTFETTLSGKTYAKLIRELQSAHWQVDLIYLYLPSMQNSLKRVAERVKHGGHDIPIETIKRRYPKSLYNLIHLYTPLCDTVYCFDNHLAGSRNTIFTKTANETQIYNQSIYQKLKEAQ